MEEVRVPGELLVGGVKKSVADLWFEKPVKDRGKHYRPLSRSNEEAFANKAWKLMEQVKSGKQITVVDSSSLARLTSVKTYRLDKDGSIIVESLGGEKKKLNPNSSELYRDFGSALARAAGGYYIK